MGCNGLVSRIRKWFVYSARSQYWYTVSIIEWYKTILIFLCLLRVKWYLEGGQSFCPGIPFRNMSFLIKIIKKLFLCGNYEKTCWIWLFNKNTLKKCRIFDSVRDDLRRCAIIWVKRGVYKVLDMVFRCREDANNFKNIFNHFGGQNHYF